MRASRADPDLAGAGPPSSDPLTLAQSEARYRGLLEAAPDAMVVVDLAGHIVLLNVQTEQQFGYRRDELLGQAVKNIIPEGFAERLIADDLRSDVDTLAQRIGTGLELVARRKDGSEFPIELMLNPLESAGEVLITAAIRDISVRRASETLVRMEAERLVADQALRASEERYRLLLEAAPDSMVVVDEGGNIVLLNVQAEKKFGYPRDELLGQPVTNIVPDGFAERLVADALRSHEEALAQQIGTGIELVGRRKDGTEFPIEIMLSPLTGPDGLLVTAAMRDISVRKAVEQELLDKVAELHASNLELEEFAYVASHDLQEPLRMVSSYTQLLAKRYKGRLDPDADDFIDFAVDGATRMQRLIADLLSYSRVGTKGLDLVPTSSHAALQQALVNLSSAIEESGATIEYEELPMVMGDRMQLEQLFQNIVGNALNYRSAAPPHVTISVSRRKRRTDPEAPWTFEVTDNGIGIDPEFHERIFGMFQRLHGRDEFAGTGIGLAIARKIAERHGGSISVESQLGQGSTFRFTLRPTSEPA